MFLYVFSSSTNISIKQKGEKMIKKTNSLNSAQAELSQDFSNVKSSSLSKIFKQFSSWRSHFIPFISQNKQDKKLVKTSNKLSSLMAKLYTMIKEEEHENNCKTK